jgi:hypothetical protein
VGTARWIRSQRTIDFGAFRTLRATILPAFISLEIVNSDIGERTTAWNRCACESGFSVERFRATRWPLTHCLAVVAVCAVPLAGQHGTGDTANERTVYD